MWAASKATKLHMQHQRQHKMTGTSVAYNRSCSTNQIVPAV